MSGCPDCTPTKLCKWHKRRAEAKQPKPLRRTPLKKKVYKINRESDKRAKENRKYGEDIKQWKEQNPLCVAKLEGCTVNTDDCHHPAGRQGDKLNDPENRVPVCRNCHMIIETQPARAKKLGLSKSRITPNNNRNILR